MSAVRVRQHVNPLSQKYQTPIAPPDWATLYQTTTNPLHLDIGCARGQFLLEMAQAKPDWNFLGVEIREPLVVRANEVRDELGLKNLHYLFCNINVSLSTLLGSQMLGGATIQFPDPWFKKRHQKRRVAQPELIQTLADRIQPEGFLFIQSDVLDVAEQMRAAINAHPAFQPSPDSTPWMPHNPLPVATEREIATLLEGKPVYRSWFTRLSNESK
ncbi:tRNA (guanosine(46)-N7)-methyltransferase TrmB [Altericista sp. CCNU0014]|uniref:tRNA (guanosine(46)-N7)-methyltransferase TrmB n=1 Tax=Altericista sp. CCNU0014 TaxID=3082949 RepID=UPI0038502D8D